MSSSYRINLKSVLANRRNKNKVVAIGSLMSQDKPYVVGGNMLGDELCGVFINRPIPVADEKNSWTI
jgi:hypothetical protein